MPPAPTPPLTLGSLCTGYGGLDMAVASVLDVRTAWVADPDPGARRVLDHHHPDVPNLGDITALDWRDVPPVDVLTAGYPCQPFSSAGRQRGAADERHIWPWIATGIRVLRPRYVVLENVANHLRLGFGTVLGDLARLGFDAEWCLVRASEVGAPHRRERLFVLAWSADASGPGRQGADHQRGRPGRSGEPAADADDLRSDGSPDERRQDRRSVSTRNAAPHPDRGGLAGHPERDRQPHSGEAHDEHRLDADRRVLDGWGQYAPAIARWERVLGRPAPDPTEPAPRGGRRLSPAFVEWMQGLPAGHVTEVPGLTRGQMLRLLGNGVVPRQGAEAYRMLLQRAAAEEQAA
jgi:DNA (cytosine-5)-methyltransferase 1